MSTAPLREAGRVIILDDDQRVLLLHYAENGGFWATPGGSLEEDEDHASAARRELNEELGIAEKDVKLSGQLAERSQSHAVAGHDVRQVEQYFLARLTPAAINPASATQTDNIRAHRWWTRKELRTTHQRVYPIGLADLITTFLDHGMPDQPVILR
ncbi:NUDIX hydrolase [Streptomyces graminilatus]|uniref:NUDIX hydrolase n=1 Tax=Streptomyces graminilatus TaxID=1464070 RepID=UPI0007C81B97|nr:NUDIX domain-containing protein [Streptomyces graminilatus]